MTVSTTLAHRAGTLLGRHQPWIFNLAFRMVLVRQDAEDVTQEILIKVLTSLSTYDPSRAAFRTWLYRIVVNHVINMRKRGKDRNTTSASGKSAGPVNVSARWPKAN